MHFQPQYRVYIAFFLFAMCTGSLFSRLPDLQLQLGVNKAELGLTLIGMAIGSLISLTLSSPLIVRLGSRTTLAISLLGVMALLFFVTCITGKERQEVRRLYTGPTPAVAPDMA